MSRPVRRALAVVVLTTYGWPLALAVLSDMSHFAYHVADELREREARAAALGLVHAQDEARFVHSHGGDAHSHGGAVDGLLVAAEHSDEEGDGGVAPIVELSAHTPAVATLALVALPVDRATNGIDLVGTERARALPLVPPPRA